MAAKKKAKRTKGAARKRAAPSRPLSAALAEAAWQEADQALAEALSEFEAWQGGDAGAALFVGQALRRAARRRGLTPLGESGAVEPYSAKRHALTKAIAHAPKAVRILRPGIARGGEVLVKARVAPVRRKK